MAEPVSPDVLNALAGDTVNGKVTVTNSGSMAGILTLNELDADNGFDQPEMLTISITDVTDPDAVAAGSLGMDDPWYGGESDFDLTYAEIVAAAPGVVDHVRRVISDRTG